MRTVATEAAVIPGIPGRMVYEVCSARSPACASAKGPPWWGGPQQRTVQGHGSSRRIAAIEKVKQQKRCIQLPFDGRIHAQS